MNRLSIAALAVAVSASACSRPAAPPPVEAESLNVTDWTDKTELYMEYPPLVARKTALFAVHLTTLAAFSALKAGRPRLEFVPDAGGAPVTLNGNDPSRRGAFRVEGAPPAAGRYRWALLIDAPGLSD